MNERDLARMAEYTDEEAFRLEDFELDELLKNHSGSEAKQFKDKYGEFYDDVKFKERDWW